MSAPKHNTNAQKGSQAATSWLQIRVTPADKAGWVKAARESGSVNLTEWVTRSLNATPEMIHALELNGRDEREERPEMKASRGALARAAYHH